MWHSQRVKSPLPPKSGPVTLSLSRRSLLLLLGNLSGQISPLKFNDLSLSLSLSVCYIVVFMEGRRRRSIHIRPHEPLHSFAPVREPIRRTSCSLRPPSFDYRPFHESCARLTTTMSSTTQKKKKYQVFRAR